MRLKYYLQDKFLDFKWRCQRFKRGYADVDVWNIDAWFLDIMPKMLKQLNEERCGHPCDLTDKQWGKILNKMITCFTEANEDTCTKENKYQKEYDQMWEDFTNQYGYFGEQLPQPEECIKEGSTRMFSPYDKEINNKEWQKLSKKYFSEENKIDKYRERKLQEGLDLFKEYFWNLWD